jgi:hypothetical protein
MAYQIFTRTSHRGGRPTPGSRPRRVCVVETFEEARAYCARENDRRSKVRVRDGFHHEFAELGWYGEAFGTSRK